MPEPTDLFRLTGVRPPALPTLEHPVIAIPQRDQPVVYDPEFGEIPVDVPPLADSATGLLLDLGVPENDPQYVVPLRAVDEVLGRHDGRVSGRRILRMVQERTGRRPAEVVQSETWRFRIEVLDWYLQRSMFEGGDVWGGYFRRPNAALRARRVMALLEVLAQLAEGGNSRWRLRGPARGDPPESSDQELPTAEEVRLFITYATVQLANAPAPGNVLARPPSVGDLKVVRLGDPRYEAGAIAHIENVMATEKRKRRHELREENERTTTTETERIKETSNDLTTNSQVQMQQMAMETLTSSVDAEAGAKVSASYGPTVSVELEGHLATHDSKETVNQASQSLANSVTQTARDRLVERTRTQTTTRNLVITDELNVHGFDNTRGTANRTGVYRYVNQVQDAWVENYGKRLMLEFIVPEPAALLRWAMSTPPDDPGEDPEPPRPHVDPNNAGAHLTPDQVTELNYLQLSGRYGAAGVTPPPPTSVDIGNVWAPPQQGTFDTITGTLTVPDGFEATSWHAEALMWGENRGSFVWEVGVGDGVPSSSPGDGDNLVRELNGTFSSPRREKSSIPVIMLGADWQALATSISVRCNRSVDTLNEWKLAVFDAVMTAWRQDHEEWEARQARAAAQARGAALTAPIVGSDNPAQNRIVEQRELRRNVIAMLLGEDPDRGWFAGDAVIEHRDGDASSQPTVNLGVAAAERQGIAFMEQSFEWSQMSYVHYPYYWADTAQWRESIARTATDPLWAAFLSAGASRVVVPVRPGFEHTVCLFLATGVFWPGGNVPTVGDPAYLGIAEEVAESLGTGGVEPERTPLDPVVLPTPLIWLQPTGDLNPPSSTIGDGLGEDEGRFQSPRGNVTGPNRDVGLGPEVVPA